VREQGKRGQHLGRGLQGAGQKEQGAHVTSWREGFADSSLSRPVNRHTVRYECQR
jgi:hypothetical protein